MNLKDFDFVNECIEFVNSFNPGSVPPLTMDTMINDSLYEKYIKAVEMCVKLKSTTPEAQEIEQKAESAKKFLLDVKRSKKVTRL